MSKRELVEYISGTYPSINPRNYRGESGIKRLYAIYRKLVRQYGGR